MSRLEVLFGLVRAQAARRFPWLGTVKVGFCPLADRHHAKTWRQFAHTNHRVYTVCFARAADVELTDEEILGISAHELGHIVGIRLRYPEHSVRANPPHWKEPAEQEANRIAAEVLGFEGLRINRRTLQELCAVRHNPGGQTFREIFEAELARYGVSWCRSGAYCKSSQSHTRGFATKRPVMLLGKVIRHELEVHLDSEIATRRTLHRGLHEIGHLVNDERGMRRFEKEEAANDFAERRMRELGVPVPRSEAKLGRSYVSRMKRWGDSISRSSTK